MSETNNANNGVYFLSLELENVRCFGKKQKLDLSDGKGNPARWTVILGNNGTGKTTLLQILNKGMQFPSTRLSHSLRRINANESKITWYFSYDSTFSSSNFVRYFEYCLHGSEFKPTGDIPLFVEEEIYDHVPNVFYTASRKIEDISRLGSIYDKSSPLNVELWLLDKHHIAGINPKFKNHFELVKETLTNLLPDVTDIKVYLPNENKPELKLHFLTNGIWLSLDALSLGYQSMVAWIVDFAARLFKHYPTSKNPIEEPAVVLIDEIDLHLHPKWQREIMRYLSERFINTQFIVTAHSPLIVQAAEDENANIVVLRREGDEVIIDQQHKAIHGWRVDQLLASDLFGNQPSHSPKNEKLLEERRAILGKPKLTAQDKKELKRLDLEMGDIPTAETPEDIKAMDIIRRAAKLLEAEND